MNGVKIYLKQISQKVFKELMELELLKTNNGNKNFCVVNKQKNSRQKTYYVEHQDFTEKEYEKMIKEGRKSPNILDEYYSIVGHL